MKLVMSCVYDVKGETFSQPWFTTTAAAAVRTFGDLVNNPERGGLIYTHPEDYQLFEMGVFDDNSGKFHTLDIPKHLVSGSSIRSEKDAIDRSAVSVVR